MFEAPSPPPSPEEYYQSHGQDRIVDLNNYAHLYLQPGFMEKVTEIYEKRDVWTGITMFLNVLRIIAKQSDDKFTQEFRHNVAQMLEANQEPIQALVELSDPQDMNMQNLENLSPLYVKWAQLVDESDHSD